MFLGGIRLRPANAAAVGGVMIAAMSRWGYPAFVLGQCGGQRPPPTS